MLNLAITAVLFLFSLMVIYGALSDLSNFTIPNWVSYGLIGLFAVHATLVWLNTPYMPSLEFRLPPWAVNAILAFVVLVVCVVFWKLRFIGGGDVKYLTATSLWMGPQNMVLFLIILTVIALAMVGLLRVLGIWNPYFQGSKIPQFAKRLLQKAEINQLPYGFPIGMAALLFIPAMFNGGT